MELIPGGMFRARISARSAERSAEDPPKLKRLIKQRAVISYSAVPHEFEPSNRFIYFLNRDPELLNELRRRPPAFCRAIVRFDRRRGFQKLHARDLSKGA